MWDGKVKNARYADLNVTPLLEPAQIDLPYGLTTITMDDGTSKRFKKKNVLAILSPGEVRLSRRLARRRFRGVIRVKVALNLFLLKYPQFFQNTLETQKP